MKARIAAVLLLPLVLSCAQQSRIEFYPNNTTAGKTGLLATIIDGSCLSSAAIALNDPTGERYVGRCTALTDRPSEYGSIHQMEDGSIRVSGADESKNKDAKTSQSKSSHSTFSVNPGTKPGQMSLVGNRGGWMNCEYEISTWDGAGIGTCQRSDGALFRIQLNPYIDPGAP